MTSMRRRNDATAVADNALNAAGNAVDNAGNAVENAQQRRRQRAVSLSLFEANQERAASGRPFFYLRPEWYLAE